MSVLLIALAFVAFLAVLPRVVGGSDTPLLTADEHASVLSDWGADKTGTIRTGNVVIEVTMDGASAGVVTLRAWSSRTLGLPPASMGERRAESEFAWELGYDWDGQQLYRRKVVRGAVQLDAEISRILTAINSFAADVSSLRTLHLYLKSASSGAWEDRRPAVEKLFSQYWKAVDTSALAKRYAAGPEGTPPDVVRSARLFLAKDVNAYLEVYRTSATAAERVEVLPELRRFLYVKAARDAVLDSLAGSDSERALARQLLAGAPPKEWATSAAARLPAATGEAAGVLADLVAVGHRSPEPVFMSALASDDPAVLTSCVEQLAKLGSMKATRPLADLAERSPTAEVSTAARAAIERIRGRQGLRGMVSLAEEQGALSIVEDGET